ncbi:type I DNA topoisomerase [Bogoriella caseilytica]|uniref:DNA topoisomerase 1 n=1 Tax=Bogoriella caseilytica TaxID=56055 RepID=A0A3N2BD96_9MICO|nr:type I DNA topoisomerase [Bogoriella caseilytica]ROR73218.1 DNA topoisomerase-1 [Bogoriella caseilytica]
MATTRKLVIVESPAKARTIGAYLGPEFDVEASVGHIRDLPQPSELPQEMKKGPFGKFAVDVEGDFDPYYVVDAGKKKKVAELRKALKESDELYLATDEDREGEAIAWHLLDVLKPKVPVKRMVFHEITREAITRALENTRELDDRLVDAQETRRILDRLVGYEVSPLLWRKIKPGISAGRVQSVATRLVVERERERMSFRSASYWDVRGLFSGADSTDTEQDRQFTARLVSLDGRRVATGRDFADDGELKPAATKAEVLHLAETNAREVAIALEQAAAQVVSMETKPYTRRPAAPFTTSTLQQEASRKLRWSARETMRTAQGLYENGYITYMRTDSPVLSAQAIAAARSQAAELYGAEYVHDKARTYGKSKGAQEAHEAIRPAGDAFRTPGQVASSLSPQELKLYDLIWKRTVASQMADARGQTATVRLGADLPEAQVASLPGSGDRRAELSASGTVITFRGFLAAYEEGRDAERYEDNAGKDSKETRLPQLAEGDAVSTQEVTAEGHETSPPPRYTEASLVKAMEERGIGRPSTYAATISVITDRGYVERRGQALVPTWLAFSVVRLLEENLPKLVDYDFTAAMEADLDRIAAGDEQRTHWLASFYRGDDQRQGLKALVEDLGDIDARAVNSIDLGEGLTLRVGRYGPYIEEPAGEDEDATDSDGEKRTSRRASVPDDIAPDELTVEVARELLAKQADDGRELGTDPETGRTIIAKNGRYGAYVTEVVPEMTEEEIQAHLDAQPTEYYKNGKPKPKKKPKQPKPRTGSLLQSMALESVTLEDALKLLSLPRVVGTDAEGQEITAQNGRFGPYLKKGTDSRSLESEEQIFSITLEEALAIYAQPKQRRGQTARPPLKELAADPVSGKPVVVKDGRFGPYVTDGETNATLRRDDSVEQLTDARAHELLAEKRAKGPAKGKSRSSSARSTAKKPAARKPAAKKSR